MINYPEILNYTSRYEDYVREYLILKGISNDDKLS